MSRVRHPKRRVGPKLQFGSHSTQHITAQQNILHCYCCAKVFDCLVAALGFPVVCHYRAQVCSAEVCCTTLWCSACDGHSYQCNGLTIDLGGEWRVCNALKSCQPQLNGTTLCSDSGLSSSLILCTEIAIPLLLDFYYTFIAIFM